MKEGKNLEPENKEAVFSETASEIQQRKCKL